MFCKSCGMELNDSASFCNNCGTPVGQTGNIVTEEHSKKEDNVVRMEIKPTFVWGYQILTMIKDIFITLVVLEITCLNIIYALQNVPVVGWAIIGIVSLIYIIKLFFQKAQYKNTSFRFLKTKVEYIDGFLNKEEKQLKYEHIREVTMTQNVFERMFGIGRIRLYTNASSAFNNSRRHTQTGKNGIDIHCVIGVREKTNAIKQIIDDFVE